MGVVYTHHAKQRMLQRNITEKNIIQTVDEPDYTLTSFEERKIAVKCIGSKAVHVVYKSEKGNIIVITVY